MTLLWELGIHKRNNAQGTEPDSDWRWFEGAPAAHCLPRMQAVSETRGRVWGQDWKGELECSFPSSLAQSWAPPPGLVTLISLLLWGWQSGWVTGSLGLGSGTRRLQKLKLHLLPPTHSVVRGLEARAGSDHEDGKCGLAS